MRTSSAAAASCLQNVAKAMENLASVAAAGAVGEDVEREFHERMAECSTLAFRVAYSVLRHRHDAEDVAQDAFVRAHRAYRGLRDRDRFRAWLVKTTWRLAVDRCRAERRRIAREQRTVSLATANAADTVEADHRAAVLWAAIDALPEKLRAVIVLSGIEGHDLREVATLLDVPEGTVKSRLFAARQKLRECLGSPGKDQDHG